MVQFFETVALTVIDAVADVRHCGPSLQQDAQTFAKAASSRDGLLSRLTRDTVGATPIGVFRDVERPVYDDLMDDQLRAASEQKEGELGALLAGGDTWTIS